MKNEYNKNIYLNYAFRLGAIALGLLSIRVSLEYLGEGLYGLWATVSSIISWMGSGDFGIANGLRNQLAEAYANDDTTRQAKLIATAVNSLSKITAVLFLLLIFLSEVFFCFNILDQSIRLSMYITSLFFCINLILGIAQPVLYAFQKSWLCTAANFGSTVLIIFFVALLGVFFPSGNLVLFAIINGFAICIPNIILIFVIKKRYHSVFRNAILLGKDNSLRSSIMNVGLQFFGIQLCATVLYSTDNVIINYLFDSESVTKYSIITKVYDTGNSLFSILLVALWSAVTYQVTCGNFAWVKRKIRQLIGIWFVFLMGVISVTVLFNQIVVIWLGATAPRYDWKMLCLFGIYSSLTAFSAIFVNVINGMGKIKLQLYVAIFCAVINIPLSVFFSKYCNMGIFGVKLATFVCAVITAVIIPIQVIYIMKKQTNEAGKKKE